jgi:hypothetical protein
VEKLIEVSCVKDIEKHVLVIEDDGDRFAALINDCLIEGMECLTVYERWSRHPDLNRYEKVLESWDNRVCQVWEPPDKLYLDCDEWLVDNELHAKHTSRINNIMILAFQNVR